LLMEDKEQRELSKSVLLCPWAQIYYDEDWVCASISEAQ
jgi:hypothetical protein